MPHAIDRSGIVPEMSLANYNGHEIPEIGVIVGRNTLNIEHDIHFGMNARMTAISGQGGCPVLTPYLQILGPRAIDIANRGGRVAEDTWFYNFKQAYRNFPEVQATQNDFRKDIPNMIYDWNMRCILKPNKRNYPAGANYTDALGQIIDLSGQARYYKNAIHKGFYKIQEMEKGVRWSKSELWFALKSFNSNIHFHLDGLGNVFDVINKIGQYAYNVSPRELRFVHRYWNEFRGFVHFYNGYDAGFNVVEVQCPWE